jgi:hypothetical protein
MLLMFLNVDGDACTNGCLAACRSALLLCCSAAMPVLTGQFSYCKTFAWQAFLLAE